MIFMALSRAPPRGERSMEDAVKPIVLAALADEAVQKEMSKCLDISALIAKPEVQRQLLESIDIRQLFDDDQMKDQLNKCLADPALQQQLLSSIDLGALVSDPAV